MTQRLAARSIEVLGIGAASVLAVLLIFIRPAAAIGAVFALAALIVVSRTATRHLVAALLVYLVVEAVVLTHVPGNALIVARYAPEMVLFAVVFARGLPKLNIGSARLGVLTGPLILLTAAWLGSAIWNVTSLSTVAIGFRSELRFLPLVVLPLLSDSPRRDGAFYGRVLVLLGIFESLVAAVEVIGGPGLRASLAPSYSIVIGGTVVAGSSATDTSSIFGTFTHYNALGIFLVLAWIVLASAGSERLGFSRRTGRIAGLAMVGGIIVSGSRESALALLIAALVIGRSRYRLPVVYSVVLVVLIAALAAPILQNLSRSAPSGAISYTRLSTRWYSLFSPATWTANAHSNFRLYLLATDVKLVARQSPAFGFGIGSVSDRRRLDNGTSPLFQTAAGRRAAAFSYLYDGGWALILVEVGFVGLAVLGLLFFRIGRLASRLSGEHWIGLALLAELIAIGVIGFFAPVLQLRLPSAVLWLFVGLALAIRYMPEASERT